MSHMSDPELARRIVDQVERGIRREGLTGPAGGTEARRRFDVACPWRGEIGTERERAYWRAVNAAYTRLFSPGAGPVVVDIDAPARLAVLPELEAWARQRGVEMTEGAPPAVGYPAPAADGAETLDIFAEGGAA